MSNGQAVLPTNGTFIVTDNQADVWPVIDQPDSGEWEVTAYNTDIYPHTVYLDFFLQVVGNATEVTTYYSNASLSSPSAITTPPPITVPAITTPEPITTPAPITIPAITTPAFITTPPPVTTPVPVSGG